jgi:phosphatidylserine decarboxylase
VVFQAKGFPYRLHDLLSDPRLEDRYRDGTYATLRLTSNMYHRFHAPHDCRVRHVTYISGDTWNVNPIALKRVEQLFCRNERAVIETWIGEAEHLVTLVPVAAILVASIRLHCLTSPLHLRYRGANVIDCSARYARAGDGLVRARLDDHRPSRRADSPFARACGTAPVSAWARR